MTPAPDKTAKAEASGVGKSETKLMSAMISCEKLFLPGLEKGEEKKDPRNGPKTMYKCNQIPARSFTQLLKEMRCVIISFIYRAFNNSFKGVGEQWVDKETYVIP